MMKLLTKKQNEVKISDNEKIDNIHRKIESKAELQIESKLEIELDIEHELQAEALIATKPIKILHNEELEVPIIEAVNDKVQKVVKNKFKEPVTEKLDVNEELQRAEYVTQWAQKVMEGEYDTIFFNR